VIRGGGWDDFGDLCRAGYRFKDNPQRRYEHLGFRVAAARREG
jgi:formylglycine-generating enzyme required for sulfatase activity